MFQNHGGGGWLSYLGYAMVVFGLVFAVIIIFLDWNIWLKVLLAFPITAAVIVGYEFANKD